MCATCGSLITGCQTCGGTTGSACTACVDNTLLLSGGVCSPCPAGCLTCTHTVVATPRCLTCDAFHYLDGVNCILCTGATGTPM